MQVWMTIVLVLQLLAAIVMIGLVLIQHGKGADMGAAFGSGASGSLFGATGSANFLSRSTALCAVVFFLSTLALAYVGVARPTSSGGASVLERMQPAASAVAPAVPIPDAASAPASAALPAPAAASGAVIPR